MKYEIKMIVESEDPTGVSYYPWKARTQEGYVRTIVEHMDLSKRIKVNGLDQSQKVRICADEILTRSEKFKGGCYTFTLDNMVKMIRIFDGAIKAKIPIIISGETGVGKTHLINFLVTEILEDQFVPITLDAGYTTIQLIKQIESCFDLAEKNSERKLWILFDEFNTTSLQNEISKLMSERRSSISTKLQSVPENIVFIACCNPYRFDTSKDSTYGEDDIAVKYQRQGLKKSHLVYPISESMLGYVYDFGVLKEDVERSYVQNAISQSLESKHKDRIENLSGAISQIQQKIRSIENEDSSTSLRDLTKFIKCFQFYDKNWKDEELSYDQKLAISITICYLLRIGNKESQKELIEKIQEQLKWTNKLDIKQLFDEFSQKLLSEALEVVKSLN